MRLALSGLQVKVGSRDALRAGRIAAELNERMEAHSPEGYIPLEGLDNQGVVVASQMVMLTVPYENACSTLSGLVPEFGPGKIFVDVTVPLEFGKTGVKVVVPAQGSGSHALREILPVEIPLCGAAKTLPAHVLEELDLPLDCNTFVYGDDKQARETLVAVLSRILGLVPLDVGGLNVAATIEGMTALLIRINRKTKSREGRFKVAGLSK